ncbi:hypothetical protein ACWOAH_00690 [Vagococcus vulneris]|nr:hypothetical protein [Vagococcus vulneris]
MIIDLDKVAKLIFNRNISANELAEKVGMSHRTVLTYRNKEHDLKK